MSPALVNAEWLTGGVRGEEGACLAPVFFLLALPPIETEGARQGMASAIAWPAPATSSQDEATGGLGRRRRVHLTQQQHQEGPARRSSCGDKAAGRRWSD